MNIDLVDMDQSLYYLCWNLPVILLYCYIADAAKTWKSAKTIPIAGDLPTLAPRFILNLIFATQATKLCRESYRKVRQVMTIRPRNNYTLTH
jgi:hypothetical protein